MSSSSKLTDIILNKRISDTAIRDMQVCLHDGHKLHGNSDPTWSALVNPSPYAKLVFPLKDMYGTLRGIAYRSEYLKFSYDKAMAVKPSEMLYGLHLAHPYIVEAGYAIIVEGVFDFLRLYDVGIRNAVSTLGARLSWAQMCLLARFCDTVVVCYDPDAAGVSATKKAITTLTRGGMLSAPVYISDDPDDFVNKEGADKLLALCSQSMKNIGEIRIL